MSAVALITLLYVFGIYLFSDDPDMLLVAGQDVGVPVVVPGAQSPLEVHTNAHRALVASDS